MNGEWILDAMNLLDEKLVEETGRIRKKRRRSYWPLAAAVAACLCLFIFGGRGKSAAPQEMEQLGNELISDSISDIEAPGEAAQMVTFTAEVLEVHEQYLLVEPELGSSELQSASRIQVPLADIPASAVPKAGDMVEIEYDGMLQETYPARISRVYSVRVIGQQTQ